MPKFIFLIFFVSVLQATAQQQIVWHIGENNHRGNEFALGTSGYKSFVANFGGENTVFNVGYSSAAKHWPFVLPGPLDSWSGGGYWAGFHPRHFPRIFFSLPKPLAQEKYVLTIGLADVANKNAPKVRVNINGHRTEKQLEPGSGKLLTDSLALGKIQTIKINVPSKWLKEGLNTIQLGCTTGSWAIFDYIDFETESPVRIGAAFSSLILSAKSADFEYLQGLKRVQPLIIDIHQFDANQKIKIAIEGLPSINKTVEKGHSILEVPMPALKSSAKSVSKAITISAGNNIIYKGTILRSSRPLHTYADYVDLLIGTGNSRWMFKPGPSLPLSMVQIAPDNQDETWKAGYEYTIDNIMGFSHFSDWTLCGLLMMPTGGKLQVNPGKEDDPDGGYRSRIDKKSEKGQIGKYSVFMTDTRIQADITATKRASMQRYTFPKMDSARILIDLFTPNEYPHNLVSAKITKVSNTEIEGFATYYNAFTGYSLEQSYTVYFVVQFSKPFLSMGGWVNSNVVPVKAYIPEWHRDHEFTSAPEIHQNINEISGKGDLGIFLNYKTKEGEEVKVRTGVSLVDLSGARNNLETEINKPFKWNFEEVVANQRKVWNELLGRVEIETDDYLQKVKFYTNLYRALSAKAIGSDVDGRFTDENEQIRKLSDNKACIVSGEYWNTFWNNQQLFNLVAPEISSQWAKSAIALYKNSGWFNTDPAGVEQTGVMVAMHLASQIQGAWQSGIRDFDLSLAYEGLKKMLTVPPQNYSGGGTVGVEDLNPYQQYGYIPQGMGAVSNTMEYAYDDFCLAQMALTLGKQDDYQRFLNRSNSWKNIMDTVSGFVRPKNKEGKWMSPFDPYHTPGFVEGNSFNYTWFVPHDPNGLISAIGKERFINRLDTAMLKSSKANFNALGDNFSAYPINHGNEPTMQVAYLFNWAGVPHLTQKWVRAIQEQYYGCTPYDAYPGDEDLGQMSSWFVMSAIGLFQMDGGCSAQPVYELGSPRYSKITVHLDGKYNRGKELVIEASDASKENKYIKSASFNGQPLNDFKLLQSEVLKGGKLKLQMVAEPNMKSNLYSLWYYLSK
ncbi:GH92 family glycosyl hydrolase [Solitalea lacus]|uniref:GH92 family glycosyl hydrolase n=1 Tax=Solitalea lacus TaxID=2911172 RepID=UPI001EDAC362|nr:GH92 family glycosyl hydrolase [Solitalea lacus]UKJ06792.1 GH92 family glycosyl hydrolase [Solitalea lacus]